ncbi:hypothetical protein [Clostridium sp.]|uniref:hypothetical protein n=1 Tax=Clostridium sp. TaxID=1506 RepID=UPI0032174F31
MNLSKKSKIAIMSTSIVVIASLGGCYYKFVVLDKNNSNETLLADANNEEESVDLSKLDANGIAGNLNEDIKVINAAQKAGEWDISMLDTLSKRLTAIEARLAIGDDLGDTTGLLTAIMKADESMWGTSFDASVYGDDYRTKSSTIEATINSIKAKMGVENTLEYRQTRSFTVFKTILDSMASAPNDGIKESDVRALTRNIKQVIVDASEPGYLTMDSAEFMAAVKQSICHNAIRTTDKNIEDLLTIADKEMMTLGELWWNSSENNNKIITTDKGVGDILSIKSPWGSPTAGQTLEEVRIYANDLGRANPGTVAVPSNASKIVPKTSQPIRSSTDTTSKAVDYTLTKAANGIMARYGNHVYGCKTQEEYDAVMKVVDEIVSKPDTSPSHYRSLQKYKDGARSSDFTDTTSVEYEELKLFEVDFEDFLEQCPLEFQEKALNDIITYHSQLYKYTKQCTDPKDGTPSSAYDVIGRKLNDCDADAQLSCAVFDALGYSTAIRRDESHGWALVNVEGVWCSVGGLTPLGLGGREVTPPTYPVGD